VVRMTASTRRVRCATMTEPVSKEIEPAEIVTKQVNNNGQLYLGRDLGGKTVVVAYEVVDDE